jgi:hypothetical protein
MTFSAAVSPSTFIPAPTSFPSSVPEKTSENTTPTMRFQRASEAACRTPRGAMQLRRSIGEKATAGRMRTMEESSMIVAATQGFDCKTLARRIVETQRLSQNICSNPAPTTETAGHCSLLKGIANRWVGRLLQCVGGSDAATATRSAAEQCRPLRGSGNRIQTTKK